MRPIDADELYELIDGGYDINFDETPETKRELLRMIDYQETVDAVPVVRCKDCIHNPDLSDDDICPFVDSDGHVREFPNDDFFCKSGKGESDATVH